jgi:sulfatase modifying factor 1
MVWIPGGEFDMGGVGEESRKDEFPVHKVKVSGFWMDETEVTVDEFRKFVSTIKYVTVAEQKPDWELLKTQLPAGTPKPDESVLVPGSLVFLPTAGPVSLDDYTQWWGYVPGANWKQPLGAKSKLDITKDKSYASHPVVQVCWFDATAYCKWTGKRLPTEAEWEFASRGGLARKRYVWGDEKPSEQNIKANLWQGGFPYKNSLADGYSLTAPVKSYAPNNYGLFEITGNVWEWVNDWYRPDTYEEQAKNKLTVNPQGPAKSFVPDEPYCEKRVVRGGSFLCNQDYCASYRPSARMSTDPYSGMSHTGFRCVMTQDMWLKQLKQKKQLVEVR